MASAFNERSLCALALEQVAEFARGRNISFRRDGNALQFRDFPFTLDCPEARQQGDSTLFLFRLRLGADGPIIAQVSSGGGEDDEAITRIAAHKWIITVFHAALAWHEPTSCPGHLSSTYFFHFADFSGRKKPWRLICSPMEFSYFEAPRGDDIEYALYIAGRKQKETAPALSPLFQHLALYRRIHWIKAFYLWLPDAPPEADLIVDNQDYPRGKALFVERYAATEPCFVHQFHIFCPATEEEAQRATPFHSCSMHSH